jgi:hypothetical protein
MEEQNHKYLIYTTKPRSYAMHMIMGLVLPFITLMFLPDISANVLFFIGGWFIWFLVVWYLIRKTFAIPINVDIANEEVIFNYLAADLGVTKRKIRIKFSQISSISDYSPDAIDFPAFKIYLHQGQILKLRKRRMYSKNDDFQAFIDDMNSLVKEYNINKRDKGQNVEQSRIEFGDDTYKTDSTIAVMMATFFSIIGVVYSINKELRIGLFIAPLFLLLSAISNYIIQRNRDKKRNS